MRNISFRRLLTALGFALLLGLTTLPTLAQTTWTGATNTDWNTATNWSAGLPDATDDVVIGSTTATTGHQPTIGASTSAVAKSMEVQSGASLSVVSTGRLTLNGSKSVSSESGAFHNYGTVNNSGQLVIGNTASVSSNGLLNYATFNNNVGGTLTIDRSTSNGLYNVGGSFTNAGGITMGAIASVGSYGLYNKATFNNQAGGTIALDNSSGYGLYNQTGSFINAGGITIGAIASVGNIGLYNKATFSNQAGATIALDNSTSNGLYNETGSFINAGGITMGATASVGNIGLYNKATFSNQAGATIALDNSTSNSLYNETGSFINAGGITMGAIASVGSIGLYNAGTATFSNQAGSTLTIDRSKSNGLQNAGTATFTNAGGITIGATASVGDIGLYNSGTATFSNNAGATIALDNSTSFGLENAGGSFINAGGITIGAKALVGRYGLYNNATFSNQAGGTLTIDRSSTMGLENVGGSFTNAGGITIGATASVGEFGLYNTATFSNQAGGTLTIDRSAKFGLENVGGSFTNAGGITIGATSLVGDYGLYNTATFSNQAGGTLTIDRSTSNGLYNSSGSFINAGGITIGAKASVGTYGLYNFASFANEVCATLTLFAIVNNSNIFTNKGLLRVNTAMAHTNTGTLTNDGIIDYPQGNPIPGVVNNDLIIAPLSACASVSPALQIGAGNNFTAGSVWYTDGTMTTPAGTYNQATNTFTVTNLTGGNTYPLSFTVGDAGSTCPRSVTLNLTLNPTPLVTIGGSLSVVPGGSTTLTASGGSSYTWSTGETTAVISVTAGVYSVTATNVTGCTGTASVTVSVMAPFAITGVTTVDCTPVQPNRYSVSFTPQFSGINGQPFSFSIANELLPTTNPGPYTLQLYTDNPILILQATQAGTPPTLTSFSYNWLAACQASVSGNTPPRVMMSIPPQSATVGVGFSYVIPSGTFTDDQTPGSLVLSTMGLPAGLILSGYTISGIPSSTVGSPLSVTIKASDPGGLSVSTSLVLTVSPGPTSPPVSSGVFSITGVSLLRCTPVADRINISFAPQYVGVNGQSIGFSVVNELAATNDPAPYSLTLYRDNPVIRLRASQTGSVGEASFDYNWLVACASIGADNTAPRVIAPVANQTATVGAGYSLNLSNVFADQETPNGLVLTAIGLPAGLSLVGTAISGTPSLSGTSTITVTATDPGNLSVATSFTLVVSPATSQTMSPPGNVFSIAGVQTVSCEVVSAGLRRVTFTPQYDGLSGQPISFRVVNELAPTSMPGPYTLNLYTDNPVINLQAVQAGSGGEVSYSYNWLGACNAGSRIGAEPVDGLIVTVLGNPVIAESVTVEVRGAAGERLQLDVLDSQGKFVRSTVLEQAAVVDRVDLRLGSLAGVYLLRVSSPTHRQTLKLVKL